VFGLFQENRGASGFVNFRYFYVYQHEIPGRYTVQREEGDRQRDIGICRCGSGHVDSNGHADKSGKQQRTGRGDVIGITRKTQSTHLNIIKLPNRGIPFAMSTS
jgi:hypothetical protein